MPDDENIGPFDESLSSEKNFGMLHEKEILAKKELSQERHDLSLLLSSLPEKPPPIGTQEHTNYLRIEKEIAKVKSKIAEKHEELMEILKNEEKINQEIRRKEDTNN